MIGRPQFGVGFCGAQPDNFHVKRRVIRASPIDGMPLTLYAQTSAYLALIAECVRPAIRARGTSAADIRRR